MQDRQGSLRDVSGSAARVLFLEGYDPSFIDQLIVPLRADESTATRIKAGALLDTATSIRGSSHGPHEGDAGRRLRQHSTGVRVEEEQDRRARVFSGLSFSTPSPTATAMTSLERHFECIVFSDLPNEAFNRVTAMAAATARLFGAATFDPLEPLAYTYLWRHLVLVAVVSAGRAMRQLEDAPDDYRADSSGRTYIVAPSYLRAHSKADGFFEDTMLGLFPEEHLLDVPLPPDLVTRHDPEAPQILETPVAVALREATQQTTKRISSLDDPVAIATVRRGDPGIEFPEPEEVLRKVRGYCLNPEHEERKYLGFASAGYLLSRAGDDRLLTHLLCSALFQPFEVVEPRATADGTLQFTVHLLLPRRHAGYQPVLTSWQFGEAKQLTLSTAFAYDGAPELTLPLALPGDLALGEDWSSIFRTVLQQAAAYGERVRDTPAQVRGALYIRHDDARSAAFARWCRRNEGCMSLRRVAMGGPITQILVDPGVGGKTEAVGSLRLAQCLLGLAGIRSHVDVEWD